MKPIQQVVAVYLLNPSNSNEFLAVKRPLNIESLPNVWGLPAVVMRKDESILQALIRVGKEKLNTQIEAISLMGTKSSDRGTYYLILSDIEARLVGQEPSVINSCTTDTKYVDQKWTNDYSILIDGASKGSLCTQIILDLKHIPYKI